MDSKAKVLVFNDGGQCTLHETKNFMKSVRVALFRWSIHLYRQWFRSPRLGIILMRCKSVITEWYKNNWSNNDAVIHCAIDRPRTGFLWHNFTNGNDYRLCTVSHTESDITDYAGLAFNTMFTVTNKYHTKDNLKVIVKSNNSSSYMKQVLHNSGIELSYNLNYPLQKIFYSFVASNSFLQLGLYFSSNLGELKLTLVIILWW